MYKKTFDFQVSVGHPIKVYCLTCYWASANTLSEARFCPYGHGPVTYYSSPSNEGEKEEVSKPEEPLSVAIPDAAAEKPTENIPKNIQIDPTGTPAEQKCMGCGYKAALPYPATCPTCRNPYPVSMVLCETWPNFLARALQEQESKPPEPEPVKVKLREGQLSLFEVVA